MQQPAKTAPRIQSQHRKTDEVSTSTINQVSHASPRCYDEPDEVNAKPGYPRRQVGITAQVQRVMREVQQTRREI